MSALRLWQLAAKQGETLAQFGLGAMYERGQGVPRDYGEAVKWWRLAAEQGEALAQSSLGVTTAPGEVGLHGDAAWR